MNPQSFPSLNNPQLNPSAASNGAARQSLSTSQPSGSRWFLTLPTGQCVGPVAQEVLCSWLQQGQVPAHSLVVQEGSQQWIPASDAFPQLSRGTGVPPVATAHAFGIETGAAPPVVRIEPHAARRLAQRRRNEWLATAVVAILFVLAIVLVPIVMYVVSNEISK